MTESNRAMFTDVYRSLAETLRSSNIDKIGERHGVAKDFRILLVVYAMIKLAAEMVAGHVVHYRNRHFNEQPDLTGSLNIAEAVEAGLTAGVGFTLRDFDCDPTVEKGKADG